MQAFLEPIPLVCCVGAFFGLSLGIMSEYEDLEEF